MAALFFMSIHPCKAIERLGYVGQTWSFPVFFTPVKSYDEITYHLDLGYFLTEKWSAVIAMNIQVAGMQIFMLELGPDFYPVQDVKVMPWISARLLYTMLPDGDAGWLTEAGIETHLSKSSELENLRLRVGVGGGQLFLNPQSTFFLEMVRVGLIWNF